MMIEQSQVSSSYKQIDSKIEIGEGFLVSALVISLALVNMNLANPRISIASKPSSVKRVKKTPRSDGFDVRLEKRKALTLTAFAVPGTLFLLCIHDTIEYELMGPRYWSSTTQLWVPTHPGWLPMYSLITSLEGGSMTPDALGIFAFGFLVTAVSLLTLYHLKDGLVIAFSKAVKEFVLPSALLLTCFLAWLSPSQMNIQITGILSWLKVGNVPLVGNWFVLTFGSVCSVYIIAKALVLR